MLSGHPTTFHHSPLSLWSKPSSFLHKSFQNPASLPPSQHDSQKKPFKVWVRSCHPSVQALQWLPTLPRITAKVLMMIYKIIHIMAPHLLSVLSQYFYPFLASLLFFKNTRYSFASGPLHLLFSFFGMVFSWTPARLDPSSLFGLYSNVTFLVKVFLDTLSKMITSPPQLHTSFIFIPY